MVCFDDLVLFLVLVRFGFVELSEVVVVLIELLSIFDWFCSVLLEVFDVVDLDVVVCGFFCVVCCDEVLLWWFFDDEMIWWWVWWVFGVFEGLVEFFFWYLD